MRTIILSAILIAAPAHGMVFMWRDSAGVNHYTNKEHEIPARYRAKAKPLYPEATDARHVQPINPAENVKTNAQPLPVTALPAVAAPLQKNIPPAAPARRSSRRRGSAEEE